MIGREHLLTTPQMVRFVHEGFLRFDGIIPADLCDAIVEDAKARRRVVWARNNRSVYAEYDEATGLGRVLRVPALQGAIESLVGPDPRFDHYATHLTRAGAVKGANWHQDAQYDKRAHAFDVQISFFPTEVTPEMGGTMFLPGSHFRRVHETAVLGYHHFVGQVRTVCEPGTVVIWHHNLWHSACSNRSDRDRYMLKLRLNPSVRQRLLWNTDDLEEPEVQEALDQLNSSMTWHGLDGRLESMQRILLWRYLTGDEEFDRTSWWTRVEAEPCAPIERRAAEVAAS